MKKFALATALVLAATLASAAEVGLEYKDYNGVNGGADANAYSLSVAGNVAPGLKADIKFQNKQEDGTNTLSTRLETGLTGSAQIYGPISGYVRGAVGEKFTNTSDFAYYSIEPGVSAKMGDRVTTSLGWRYRDAFNDANGDQTRTWRAKVGYDLTKVDNVYVGYDRQRGDSEYNAWRVGYVRSF
jgi:hypothetical protein